MIEASTNSQRSGANAHNPANPPQTCITQSGWYTFTHTFTKDHDGNLKWTWPSARAKQSSGRQLDDSSDLSGRAIADGACPAGSTTSTPLPFSAVGANFLGWFPDQEINNLAIDNAFRSDLPNR